jgi:hypothetical protein
MNRLVRIGAAIAVAIFILAGAAATTLWVYRERVIALVLAQIDQRTGIALEPKASSIQFGGHLYVFLDDVRISRGGETIANVGSIRATLGYHSILTASGLPLYAIVVASPTFTMPDAAPAPGAIALPEAAAIERLTDTLRLLSKIARRVDLTGGSVATTSGAMVANAIELSAFYRRSEPGIWRVGFSATARTPDLNRSKIAGKLALGRGADTPAGQAAEAKIWVWDLPIRGARAQGLELTGDLQTLTALKIHDDGSISGSTDIEAHRVAVSGAALSAPIAMGDYSARAEFEISARMCTISRLIVKQVDATMLSASSELSEPFGNNPRLTISIGELAFELARLKQQLLAMRNLPAGAADWLKRLGSGSLRVMGASIAAPIGEIKLAPLDAIFKNLSISASLEGAGFILPSDTKLPAITAINAAIKYERGAITIAQGSASVGSSPLSKIALFADLSRGLENAPYKLSFAADANLDELHPAFAAFLDASNVPNRDHLLNLGGKVGIEARLSGVISTAAMRAPSDYEVGVEANGAVVMIAGAPGPVQFRRGTVVLRPKTIAFKSLVIGATGGDARVDGEVDVSGGGANLRNLEVEFHQMPSETWFGLLIDPSDLSVKGPIGGRVVLNGDPRVAGDFSGDGKLTISSGSVQFNFLRAPLDVQGMTIELRERRMLVAMPAARLQGSAIDWRLTVPDIDHPSVRMDVNADRLDIEVMKFIRMPWSPATPPIHFPIPISGHIEARAAHLAALPMDQTSADFTRDPSGDWRVYNLHAASFKGRIDTEFKGRGPDNWIQIKGKVAGMDTASIFLMNPARTESPVSGRLSAAFDLWADTDLDFYNTMTGNIAITMRDGTLNRFTLLSRMLGLMDVKNWLTANVTDPRKTGVPFHSIIADFKGNGGVFYTNNFVLDGPVMDITAAGSVKMAESALDMEVALLPFDTVDWALNHIPLIGKRIGSGTGKLITAYFHVTGPVSDPSITPKPLTSLANFVMKTLGMPINLIRPDTIK